LAFPYGVHPARALLEKIGLEGEMIPDQSDGSKETWQGNPEPGSLNLPGWKLFSIL
jgi:hypothetical protein